MIVLTVIVARVSDSSNSASSDSDSCYSDSSDSESKESYSSDSYSIDRSDSDSPYWPAPCHFSVRMRVFSNLKSGLGRKVNISTVWRTSHTHTN